MLELKVKHIMTQDMVTLQADEDIDLAQTVMQMGKIRHLPVVDDGGQLLGLVTHRDLLRAQVKSLLGMNSATNPTGGVIHARDIMTAGVNTISPEAAVLEAAKLLKEHTLGCLPVVLDGKLIGMLTEADFLNLLIRTLETQNRSAPTA